MHNFGEYPNAVEESSLWQILQAEVPEKYYLSKKACKGVLRRAVKRGTELPLLLLIALIQQGELTEAELQELRLIPPPVISLDNHPADSRVTVNADNIIQTLTSRMGTGGGNTPLLLVAEGVDTFNQTLTGDKAKTLLAGHIDKDGVPCVALNILQDAISSENVAPCLSTGNPKTGQAALAVCLPYILLDDQGGGVIRTKLNAEKSPTLRAQDKGHPPCLCYSIDRAAFNQGENAQFNIGIDDKGIAHTLVAKGPGAVCYPVGLHGDKAGTLDASYYKGCGERNGTEREVIAYLLNTKWIVRRVTPTECARLQGMPDWWCKGVVHKDAPEYKMWGNGMALPCVLFVMQGIAQQLRKQLLRKIGGKG